MTIFSRLVDLFNSNANALIDEAEDPEKMLKQMIIDMEGEIQKATQGLGQIMATERKMLKQLEDAQEQSKIWENRAKTALMAGNEELAQQAVNEKIKADANVKQYQQMHNEVVEQVNVVRGQVNTLKEKMEEMRSRQSMLIARAQVADARQGIAKVVGGVDSNGVFAKMERMEQKISSKEAQADAYAEIGGFDAIKEDPFAKLEKQNAASSELERLRKELGK